LWWIGAPVANRALFLMKYQLLAALTWCTVAGLALADNTPQKKAAAPSNKTASHAAQKNVPQKAVAQKTVAPKTGKPLQAHTIAGHSTAGTTAPKTGTSRVKYTAYRRPVVRHSTAQQAPTSDRYREIQDALATQGYLKTPSNGVWDKDSMDAMQRFQTDKGLEATGKLTARSLSALGLGPKPQETNLPPANPTPSLSANPAGESTPLQ
jgi:hypothetical protein